MEKLNAQLKDQALETLKGKWGESALTTLIYVVISGALNGLLSLIPFVGSIVSTILLVPFAYGITVYFLKHYRGEEKTYSTIFCGYSDFKRIFTTLFLVNIYTMLWTLLLIVPGIIKGFSYMMTPFILADNPEMKNNEAIEKSMAMMDGNKMKLFLLMLGFIGWVLLCFLTLGIGFFFLAPYMQLSMTAFYEELKAEQPDATLPQASVA